MNLESFGKQLRAQREQKQIALANVAGATRINIKFLEAMEAGEFSVLPQTYVRAFIREYAHAVDLNPEELIRQYDEANQPAIILEAQERLPQIQRPVQTPVKSDEPDVKKIFAPLFSQRTMAMGGIFIAALAVVLYVVNMNKNSSAQSDVPEVSFDKVVKESEAAVVKNDSAPANPAIAQHPATAPAVNDSLRLEVSTLDSVWMKIVIDNVRNGEYLFAPKRKRLWMGKERFVISLGNAGSATFRLNGVDLGPLGKRGAIARNVIITESGIQKPE